MFYFKTISDKKVLVSDIIHTEHFFTTRESIIKTKESEYIQKVQANKEDICKYLGIKLENLISPSQTHTSYIKIASPDKKNYPDTDGLILNTKNIAIFLNFADCTPLIFYDEVKNIGAVSHAGWRGTAGNIATKTVNMLIENFNSSPKNISVAIGPAISKCCYDVHEDVFDKLKSTVSDFSGLYEERENKLFVDLKSINARQIEECGVTKIDIAPFCTCCNNDLFFSYRKENKTTNRHSAVLKLK